MRASQTFTRSSVWSAARLVTRCRSVMSPLAVSSFHVLAIFLRSDGPPLGLGLVRYSSLTGVLLSTVYLTCL